MAMAGKIRRSAADILSENRRDLENAAAKNLKGSFLDRLTLTAARLEAMAKGLEDIAELPDPVGQVMAQMDEAQRAGDFTRARAHRRHRHHL